VRSRCRCSMCPAIHINSRSWLRSSSTREPSDPPHRVVFVFVFLRLELARQLFVRHRSMRPNGRTTPARLISGQVLQRKTSSPGKPARDRQSVFVLRSCATSERGARLRHRSRTRVFEPGQRAAEGQWLARDSFLVGTPQRSCSPGSPSTPGLDRVFRRRPRQGSLRNLGTDLPLPRPECKGAAVFKAKRSVCNVIKQRVCFSPTPSRAGRCLQ